jgi:hypothetical protein
VSSDGSSDRMYQLDEYKAGNISLGALAQTLDLSMLETLNLVAAYNAHPHVPKDYLVEAAATAKKLFTLQERFDIVPRRLI